MGYRHLISTRIRAQTCRTCGLSVWVALSEGLPVAVDPVGAGGVDELTELGALLVGRWSFDLITVGGRTELMQRDEWRQKSRDHPVALAHGCARVGLGNPDEWWRNKRAPRKPGGAGGRVDNSPAPF